MYALPYEILSHFPTETDHENYLDCPAEVAPRRILLIDDNEVYTAILAEVILMRGFELQVIHDHSDIDYFCKAEFDLAIVDYDLGRTNGERVAELLYSTLGPLPIILISDTSKTISNRGLIPEVHDFVHKSVGVEVVLESALDALDWWVFNENKKYL